MDGSRHRSYLPARRARRARFCSGHLRFTALTLALCTLALGPSCGRRGADASRPPPPPLNLLLITIDTLRADHLSCYGYPRPTSPTIDRLAREGALFEEAITTRGQTWPSLTSLFTGEYPLVHGVRTNGQRMAAGRRTLAVDLSEAGYRTAAFLTNMSEAHHPGIDTIVACRRLGAPQWRWDDAAVAAGLDLLEKTPRGPWFLWFHLIDPHMPYAPPKPWDAVYRERGAGVPPRAHQGDFRDLALSTAAVSQSVVDEYVALYDGQINAVDVNVARILAALDSLGLRDRTLIVLVADHGEDHFERNRYFGHSCSIYQQTVRVPLIISLPGQIRAGIIAEPIEMIDLRPTILELLGRDAPRGIQGSSRAERVAGGSVAAAAERRPRGLGQPPSADSSALPSGASSRDQHAFETVIEWSEQTVGGSRSFFIWRDRQWKYVFNPDQHRIDNEFWRETEGPGYIVAREELYDLDSDPGEMRNLAGEHPDVAARMRARLSARVGELRAIAGTAGVASDSIDAATAEALRALGYVK